MLDIRTDVTYDIEPRSTPKVYLLHYKPMGSASVGICSAVKAAIKAACVSDTYIVWPSELVHVQHCGM